MPNAAENQKAILFERIYEDHFEAIYRYVFHRVGNRTEAEDLTAQCFFKALNNWWRFRWSGASISSWLFRIATNEINNYFRQIRKNFVLENAASSGFSSPHAGAQTEEGLDQVFLELKRALASLKPEEQTLLALRYFEKKTFVEIGQILRKRPVTLRMRAHRSLKKLQRALENQGVDHETYRNAIAELG